MHSVHTLTLSFTLYSECVMTQSILRKPQLMNMVLKTRPSSEQNTQRQEFIFCYPDTEKLFI